MGDTRTDFRVCTLCDAICGIAVEHDGERVLGIRGDPDDAFSRGHICPKAVGLGDVQHDPDRVRVPLRRDGSTWREVSWNAALDDIADRITEIQHRHGRDAMAFYYGNPTAHTFGGMLYGLLFAQHLGTRNLFSSNSVDSLPRLLASLWMYGNQAVLPIPDIDRARTLIILGANPLVSNGSVMTAPGVGARLAALRARGGQVIVVDPRRTETAAVADQHVFIRPGTDALLLAGMVHTVLADGTLHLGRVAGHVDGLARLKDLFAGFTPEAVAEPTGVPVDTVRALARVLRTHGPGACYGRMGTSTQAFGTVSSWLIDLVNILTGNLDRQGGVMFPSPAVDLAGAAKALGQAGAFDRWQSRVRHRPEFNGELPVAAFAEEIETPGPGQIRGLITHAGNPVLSLPNGQRIDRALASLDVMVSIDIYRNETTRHAHYILPPTFGLERDEYPLLFHGTAVRNTAHFSPALLPPPPGVRHDWEIFAALASRVQSRSGGLRSLLGAIESVVLPRLGPRALLRAMLRLGDSGLTLDDLLRAPHGIDLGPLVPRIPAVLNTPTRRIQLAPPALVADIPRLRKRLREPALPQDVLLLIGRRTLRSNNSWMHNSLRLVKGRPRCTLLMHPSDASVRGLVSGATVTVRSRVGTVDVPLEITENIMPGVVSIPHGWGHGRTGTQLAVAAMHPGVSLNDLTDDTRVDEASGASALQGVPVTVSLGTPAA